MDPTPGADRSRAAAGAVHAAAGVLLLAVAVALAGHAVAVAWDLRLPASAFALIPAAAAVAGAAQLWWSAGELGLRRAPHRPAIGAGWAAALALACAASFPPLEFLYFEPEAGPDPRSLAGDAEVRFDAREWERLEPARRAKLRRAWGRLPERVPLEVRLVSETQGAGHRRIEVVLRVERSGRRDWDEVPVVLLVPDEPLRRPAPVVIVHHQHASRFDKGASEPLGERGDPRQAWAEPLLERGLAVAAHDALGFDRRHSEPEGLMAARLRLHGRTVNGKYAFDVSRIVDWLALRPDVDATRVGLAGHSLGGGMAIYAALMDDRISVVASSCGIAPIDGDHGLLAIDHVHAPAFYPEGLLDGPPPLDMPELIGLLRGRALFLSSGARDPLFPVEGVAGVHRFAEAMYRHDGLGDRLVTEVHGGGHRLPARTRTRMADFLARQLAADPRAPVPR